jgi:hypothetical protein
MIRKNIMKAVALTAALAAPLAASGGGFGGGTKRSNPVNTSVYGGSYAYNSLETTAGAVVTLPTLMAVKTQKIIGLLGAVTAEMAESMGAGVGATATDSTKIAGSSGSNHRASTWLRASFGAIDNDASGQKWNGQSYLMMLGGDYRFNHMFGAGLAFGYSHLNARTEFNNGQMKEDTYSVNPYFLVKLHKNFNFEAFGGWSHSTHDDYRVWKTSVSQGGAALPPLEINNKFKAKPKYDSLYGGVAANLVTKVNKTQFSAQVGYVVMQSKMKKFSETSASAAYANRAETYKAINFKKQTLTGKVLVGYQMTPSVMPFLNVHGLYNVKRSDVVTFENAPKYKDPRSGFGGGGGFHVSNDDALKGSLQFDYTKMQDLSTYVTALRLHYSF